MKIYTRSEIRGLIEDQLQEEKRVHGTKKMSMKIWCEVSDLYYFGVVRFLKGGEITAETYSKIMQAIDPSLMKESRHYLAKRIFYSDLPDVVKFAKEFYLI